MTQTLKAVNRDNVIRPLAQGVVNLAAPWEYGGGRLSASCNCCSVWPDPFPSGLVDCETTTTYSGLFRARFPAYSAECGLGGTAYMDEFQGSGTGWSFRLQINPNDINGPWRYSVTITAGETGYDSGWIELTGAPPAQTFEARVSLPIRLFMKCDRVPRYNYYNQNSLWGPRGSGQDETIDLRLYENAELGWYVWPPGGSATIELDCFGQTYSAAWSGPPLGPVGAADALLAGADFVDNDPVYLEAAAWGAPDLPQADGTYWHVQDEDGVRAWTSGRRVYAERVGNNPNSARRCTISIGSIAPEQTLRIEAEAYRLDGSPFPTGTFVTEAYDGPQHNPALFEVNRKFPVDDVANDPPLEQGQTISLSCPGSWQGTGRMYSFSASAWFGSPHYSGVTLDGRLNTIGAQPPALGFVYSTSSLAANGREPDAWRFPVWPDIQAAIWPVVRVSVSGSVAIERFTGSQTGWTPGPDTNIALTGGKLRIYGTGQTLTASRTYQTERLDTFRYLRFSLESSGQRTITFTAGTRSWQFTVNGVQAVTLDLCVPHNASGSDTTTTRIEVGSGQGGWGWGLQDGITLQIQTDGELFISAVDGLSRNEPCELLVGEAIHRDNLWSYEDQSQNRFYVHPVVQVWNNGRLAVEAAGGDVRDSQPDVVAHRESIRSMLARLEASGAVILRDLRPPVGGLSMLDGFLFYPAPAWFSSQAPAYMLVERLERASDPQIWTLYAAWQADRVVCHLGVSITLRHRRYLGGVVNGIVQSAGQPVAEADVAAADGVTNTTATAANGWWWLPDGERLDVNESYTVTPGSVNAVPRHLLARRVCSTGGT